MSSTNYEKAQEQWNSFCENIKYQQRYFISHPVLDILKSVSKTSEMIIDPDKIYYRARIIDDNAAKKRAYGGKMHRGGYNLTIYDVSKCEAVFSTELRLENIKIYLRPAIGAENIDGRFEYIVDNIPMRMDKATGQMIEAEI